MENGTNFELVKKDSQSSLCESHLLVTGQFSGVTQTPSSVATMPEGQVHSATHCRVQIGGLSLFAHVSGQALPQEENTWLFGHAWVGGSVAKEGEKRGREREREGERQRKKNREN